MKCDFNCERCVYDDCVSSGLEILHFESIQPRKEYMKKYREKNKEKLLNYEKAYREKKKG